MHLEEGKPLPVPDPEATSSDADLVELVPPSVEVGAPRPLIASAKEMVAHAKGELRLEAGTRATDPRAGD